MPAGFTEYPERRVEMANLGNPKNTIEIIQKYEFNFQKKFGQNFLIDQNILEKIVNAAKKLMQEIAVIDYPQVA